MQMIHLLQGTSWGSIVESSVIGFYCLSYLLYSLQIGRHCSFPCLLMPMGVGFLTGFFCCYCSWKLETLWWWGTIFIYYILNVFPLKKKKSQSNYCNLFKRTGINLGKCKQELICTDLFSWFCITKFVLHGRLFFIITPKCVKMFTSSHQLLNNKCFMYWSHGWSWMLPHKPDTSYL